MITKFDQFLNESVRDLMKGYFTQAQIDEVIDDDDLNSAMYSLQDMLNITDGGVCGVYFSRYRNPDKKWEDATPEERQIMVDEYLATEAGYKRFIASN